MTVAAATHSGPKDCLEPVAKKAKHGEEAPTLQSNNNDEFSYCLKLLSNDIFPPSLTVNGKTRNDLVKLRKLMDAHGFRTSAIASPRPALSIYKDSCHLEGEDCDEGKIFLVTMLGLNPQQSKLELLYSTCIKNIYCLWLFCQRLRAACRTALQDETFQAALAENEASCLALSTLEQARELASSIPKLVARLIQSAVKAEPRNRIEQLEHEYQRITLWNSTFSNALVSLFLKAHDCCIKDVYFKHSPQQPKYERITVYTYDPELDLRKPPHFLFMPSLQIAMEEGPEAITEKMIVSCWSHLLRHGYFATPTMKQLIEKDLKQFFLSGITQNLKVPLHLNAHFSPSFPLSFYLFGKAGAGKSSFVRNFQPALEATIEEYLDPEILARFVKQNLNKPMEVLQLELELRPNNNDLSVMSIIQGRRMTMTQTKPGIVVVDLEEMPSSQPDANPNQLDVSQLISQRFSGRKGEYQQGSSKAAPRNSQSRGIGSDASLVTLFTSNYELATQSREALQRVKIFENLNAIEMTAVSGEDRVQFAKTYLQQCITDRFADFDQNCVTTTLDIPFGNGDTRPLVRHLRMIAFYICALIDSISRNGNGEPMEVSVTQTESNCVVKVGKETTDLRVGKMDNLFPVSAQIFDERVKVAVDALERISCQDRSELSTILDFWLAKTLAPAVIVSNDENKIKELVRAVSQLDGIHSNPNVNADDYKMMKSLYDPNDTPNLRDDILKFGRGSFVATELRCPSKDAQLCIREIIEDSPSMTAFSTAKSALYKSGLLFAVYVNGEVTPEVMSRASLII